MIGDAIDLMTEYEDNHFDLILTDPPYGIGAYNTGTMGGGVLAKQSAYTATTWDNKRLTEDYFIEMLRVSKNQIIFGGNYFTSFLPSSPCWIIWDKKGEMDSNNFADCEMIWTNFNKPARVITHLWRGMIKQGENAKRVHPTQKPIDLLVNIIERYTEEDDIILDPFLGSGSTLIACEKIGRKCYGMEIDSHYCDVILQRWADYTGKDPIREDGVKFSELQ